MSDSRIRPVPMDLSALADDPLFTESFPYACLAVRSIRRDSRVKDVLARYELATMPSAWPGLVHLHTAERQEAEHKRQAVRLFVAGIELVREGAVEQAYLHEVSQLHVRLAQAIGIDHRPYTPDGKVEGCLPTPYALSADEAVTLHLRQAGFPLVAEGPRLRMMGDEVRGLAQDLIHEALVRKEAACTAR